jgi:hypothetical protein
MHEGAILHAQIGTINRSIGRSQAVAHPTETEAAELTHHY